MTKKNYRDILSSEDRAGLLTFAAFTRHVLTPHQESVYVIDGVGQIGCFYDEASERREGRLAVGMTFDTDDRMVMVGWTVDTRIEYHRMGGIFHLRGGQSLLVGDPGLETRLRVLAREGLRLAHQAADSQNAHTVLIAGPEIFGQYLKTEAPTGRPVHDVMGDFLKAAIRGKVARLTSYPPRGSTLRRVRPELNSQAPAFDFADLTSTVKFSGSTMAELAMQKGQDLSLPFPECFFIFTVPPDSPENQTGETLVFLHHLIRDPDGVVTCRVYDRNLRDPGQWMERPFVITWAADDRPVHTLLVQAPHHRDELAKSAFLCRLRTAAAAWVLDHPPTIREQEYHAVQIPRAVILNSRKQSNIPPVVVICYDREVIERYTDPQAGPGASGRAGKSPHERRGHFRKLRDGRVIRVRPCKIHGGAQEPPRYTVLTTPA